MDFISLTKALISIPSMATSEESYENIAKYLQTEIQKLGINSRPVITNPAKIENPDFYNKNLISLLTPKIPKYNVIANYGNGSFHLIMSAHFDTVTIDKYSNQKWSYPPFAGKINNGTLYGLGAADNKSGIGIALGVLDKIKGKFEGKISITLLFTGDEEIGGYGGIGYLLNNEISAADLFISLNGSFDKINIGCYGRLWIHFVSNQEICAFILSHRLELNNILKSHNIPLRFSHIETSRDDSPVLVFDALTSNFDQKLIRQVFHEFLPNITFELEILGFIKPAISSKSFYAEILAKLASTHSMKKQTIKIGAPSDLRFAINKNIPSLSFGPIQSTSNVHKPNENVKIETINSCVEIVSNFILNFVYRRV
ncbi:MAG: M20/M25/M40 family metallo-hydrolase [Thermotogae bacterium]|jgi:acetylornithine deacetylase/succinyl-diaminopimelate desuccinylase-like protein|nr:M20/M25/M40 family metallo-hydrolase [Thermotogota bacterium]MCL5032090.1 M20/M25/M40 family metallo-hydrolase [Thermotogota bacterium]